MTDTDPSDTSNVGNGSVETQPGSGGVSGAQTDAYSGYPGLPTTAQQDPNTGYQNPMSAHQDPNSGYQNQYPGYQAANTTYADSYAGYQGYTDTSGGYTAQSYPNTTAGMSDYASYFSGTAGMQPYSYQG